MVQKLIKGPRALIDKINEIIVAINCLSNLRGDGLVVVNKTANGYALGINTKILESRIPKTAPPRIRRAYVKTEPTSGTIVDCYLDEDGGSTEIEVSFEDMISVGSTLEDHFPPLEAGLLLPVWHDKDGWRPCFPIGVIDRC